MKKHFIHYLGNVLLTLFGVLTALLLAEFALKHKLLIKAPLTSEGRFDYDEQYRLSAIERGDSYDQRTLVELISAERLQNKRVFPAASPAYFLAENGSSVLVGGRPVLPLGITASANNYYCKESGKFTNFITDQYGFRNQESAWVKQPDIVAIGDSFTMGSCLDEELSLIGQIRRSGKQVLNLGMSSNGSLIELATLKEFGLQAKPKIILWNFFANDLFDLLNEKNNPILIQYLNEDFSQNLKQQAKQINSAVDLVVEQYWKNLEAHAKQQSATNDSSYFPNIQKIYLYLKNQATMQEPNYKEALDLFVKILSTASLQSKNSRAQLVFVYLPDCLDNSYGQKQWLPNLISSVEQLGIPVIDLSVPINKLQDAGQNAYFSCPGSHFNVAGAKAAAEHILLRLSQLQN